MPSTSICGNCGMTFTSDELYLNHVCEKTGFKPTDFKNLGPEFEAVSKAALARGEAKKEASA